jgi:hypothetical protein
MFSNCQYKLSSINKYLRQSGRTDFGQCCCVGKRTNDLPVAGSPILAGLLQARVGLGLSSSSLSDHRLLITAFSSASGRQFAQACNEETMVLDVDRVVARGDSAR